MDTNELSRDQKKQSIIWSKVWPRWIIVYYTTTKAMWFWLICNIDDETSAYLHKKWTQVQKIRCKTNLVAIWTKSYSLCCSLTTNGWFHLLFMTNAACKLLISRQFGRLLFQWINALSFEYDCHLYSSYLLCVTRFNLMYNMCTFDH